ncbi:MAG: peptide-N4-asparagine amidase [Sulfolobales archaeon]
MSRRSGYLVLLFGLFYLLLLSVQVSAQPLEVIEYKDPRSFSSYWSFEPFKPLPPGGVQPVVIPIAINMSFENTGYTPKSVVVSIPPGNYSRAIINVSMRVTDRQFDRIFWIFANNVPIYWGSTIQRFNSTAEADVTLFLNLFKGDVNFSIVLANFLAPSIGITGIFLVNITLYLYPGKTPSWVPDTYIPLWGEAVPPIGSFTPDTLMLNTTLKIPDNAYRTALYLFAKPGRLDEFFYANIPSVRDILVYYNDDLAGVFHVFPTIFTGGIFPLYWRPMTSVNTHYTKSPQIIDLTPFLALGKNANISMRVIGMDEASKRAGSKLFVVMVGGALLVWTDPSRAVSGGSIVKREASYSRTPYIVDMESLGVSYYVENTRYRIYYEAILTTPKGVINTSTYSEGFSNANIYSSDSLFISTLMQNFTNKAIGSGAASYSMESGGNYLIRLTSAFTFTPTSDPSKIPYNATLTEDDMIDVWLVRTLDNSHGEDWYRETIYERAHVIGGFAINLTIIDPHGGAIITALDRASSTTTKSLSALILYNGKGYTEEFIIVTEASLRKPFGDYKEFYIKYMRI